MSKLLLVLLPELLIPVLFVMGCSLPAGSTVEPVSESELRGTKSPASTAAASSGPAVVPAAPEKPQPPEQQSTNKVAPAENRVEIVYFIAPQRCTACECVEERISNLMGKSFADACGKGRLVYTVLKLQDEGSQIMAKKYRAYGSQLFINLTMHGVDNIVEVLEVWDWDCRGKPDEFDQKVKFIIERYLTAVM